jgi:glycosyltransferase involved in cell wall biosynthesis
VCDEYAADPRIQVYHKPNGGQAAARNDGVARCRGQFISFVDCDDWLEPNMYTTMLKTLHDHEADIIICGYIEEYVHRQKYVNNDDELEIFDNQQALKMVLQGRIGSYLWSMLFRRETVQEPMPDLNPYEDHATVFKWFSHAKRVVSLHHAFYHYRQLEGSSLHSYNPKNGNHYFLAIKERYYYIKEHRLLEGWESENRRLYLRGCIKLTKDIARMPQFDSDMAAIISTVRAELINFLPITRHEIGTKSYIRLRLLLTSVKLYVSVLRASSFFSLNHQRKSKSMFR